MGSHAAGVGTGVAIAYALGVLSPREWARGLAIAEGEEAGCLAVHELLDHNLVTAVAEGAFEHEIDRAFAFALRTGDDHAFARRQSIRLDPHGKAQAGGEAFGFVRSAETLIAGSRYADLGAKVFDKALGAFQHCRRLGGTQCAN